MLVNLCATTSSGIVLWRFSLLEQLWWWRVLSLLLMMLMLVITVATIGRVLLVECVNLNWRWDNVGVLKRINKILYSYSRWIVGCFFLSLSHLEPNLTVTDLTLFACSLSLFALALARLTHPALSSRVFAPSSASRSLSHSMCCLVVAGHVHSSVWDDCWGDMRVASCSSQFNVGLVLPRP